MPPQNNSRNKETRLSENQHFDAYIALLRTSGGVVTLLDMLRFAAEDFWEASRLLSELTRATPDDFYIGSGTIVGKTIGYLRVHCVNIGLLTSVDQIDSF
jgi:hypothetical protein